MKSILDSGFRYTNSVETDVRKTFARVRREIEAQKKRDAEREAKQQANVSGIVLARR